eukprot:4093650-Pyramimonas_sp.AAC.1
MCQQCSEPEAAQAALAATTEKGHHPSFCGDGEKRAPSSRHWIGKPMPSVNAGEGTLEGISSENAKETVLEEGWVQRRPLGVR